MSRRKAFTFTTRDPDDPENATIDFWMSEWLIRWYREHAPVQFENLRCVKFVFDDPSAIFYGIREHTEGGYCYCARPDKWCVAENVVADFPRDKLFAVYVRDDGEVYTGRGEDLSKSDARFPNKYETRYEEVRWPKNTS